MKVARWTTDTREIESNTRNNSRSIPLGFITLELRFVKKCSPLTTTNNDLPQELRVLNERGKKSRNEKKYKQSNEIRTEFLNEIGAQERIWICLHVSRPFSGCVCAWKLRNCTEYYLDRGN